MYVAARRRCVRVGQADGRDPDPPVGQHGRQQVAGARARVRCPVGGQRRRPTGARRRRGSRSRDRPPVRSRISSVTWSMNAAEDREQPPVVGVRADEDVDVRAGAGGDPLDRRRRDDVAVDDRLARHGAGHHLRAPALRVGCGEHLGLDLRLRLRAAARPAPPRSPSRVGRDAEHLGEPRADPGRVARPAMTWCAAPLCSTARRNRPSARGMDSRSPIAHRAGRLAEDGDAVGVAAEGGDVLPHPRRARRPGRAGRGWRRRRRRRGRGSRRRRSAS